MITVRFLDPRDPARAPRVHFWRGKTFQAYAFGYEYFWQASAEIFFDIASQPYLLCKPVRKIPGHKKGYLRGEKIFLEGYLPPTRYEEIDRAITKAMDKPDQ